jgi:pilus assembly protein FimV
VPLATLRDKLLASAQRQVDKGNLVRAIRDYRKLLEAQPDDTRTRLRIGDLQARMGKKDEAIVTYEHVARDYAEQGFFLKAVAILKQILRLDPDRTDVQVRLAELYLKLNLLSDCMAQYRKVADALQKKGDTQRHVDVLRRMAAIDPEDVRVQITLAEHYAESDSPAEAAEHFRLAAQGLAHQERWDEYVKVAERYVFHRQDDLPTLKELVRVYVERRDYKRALAKLQLAFKLDAADVEGLDLLAQAFLGLGRQEKALRVLKELAEILSSEGRDAEAYDVYQRVLDIEPYDLDARVHLGLSMPSGIPTMEAADDAKPDVTQELRHEGSKPIRVSDLPLDSQEQWRRLKAQSGLFEAPTGLFTCNSSVSEAALDEIARLLVEIDGFEKLGLIERARATLKRAFELDPLNISAMERAVHVDLARGALEDALQRLLRMTRLCWRPDPVRAAGYLNEALKHDPDHPSALQLRGELGLDGIDLETFMLESSGAEIIEVGDISGLGDSVLPASTPPDDQPFAYEVANDLDGQFADDLDGDDDELVYLEIDDSDALPSVGEPLYGHAFAPAGEEIQVLDIDDASFDDVEFLDDGPEAFAPPPEHDGRQPRWASAFNPGMPREAPARVEVDDLDVYEVDDDDLGLDDDDLFLEPDELEPDLELESTDSGALRAAEVDSDFAFDVLDDDNGHSLSAEPDPEPAVLLGAALYGDSAPPPHVTPSPAAAASFRAATRSPQTASAVMRGTPKVAHTPTDLPSVHLDEAGLTPLPDDLPDDLLDELDELTFFMKAGMRDEAQTLLFDLATEHPEHTVLIMERMAQLESLGVHEHD